MSGNWNHQRSNNNSRQHNGHQFSGRAAVNNGSGYLYSDSRVTTNYNRDDEWTRHTTRQLEVARVRLNSSDGVAQLHGRAISLQRDAIREDRVRDQFARQQQADFNRRTRDIIVANQRREAIQAQREAVFRQRTMQEMARMRNQVVAATMAANQRRRY